MRQFESIARAGVPGVAWIARGLALSQRTARDVVSAVLKYCHALPHVADPPGSVDWVLDPCASASMGGDCDDLAVLCMALLLGAGISAKIVWLDVPGQREDHVACQAFVGGEWVWAEPLLRGAEVGEHPRDASRRLSQSLVEV